MKSFFDFQETLEVVTNGVAELAVNATEAQRTSHKGARKKDFKASYCIQVVVDGANFDWIAYAESAKEAWDVLIKYYKGGEKG